MHSDRIMELYEDALDCGISIEQFWKSTINEIFDRMESFRRMERCRKKEKIILCNYLAKNIIERFCGMADPVWDSFPELFEQEKLKYEQNHTVDVDEMRESRIRYAKVFNEQRGGAS